jgi:hypothetical protein
MDSTTGNERERQPDREIRRDRKASINALGQLDWTHTIRKPKLARALDRNPRLARTLARNRKQILERIRSRK